MIRADSWAAALDHDEDGGSTPPLSQQSVRSLGSLLLSCGWLFQNYRMLILMQCSVDDVAARVNGYVAVWIIPAPILCCDMIPAAADRG